MSRMIPGWALLTALAFGMVCGLGAMVRNRRVNRMRRMLRRACKTMSNVSSAVLHMFP